LDKTWSVPNCFPVASPSDKSVRYAVDEKGNFHRFTNKNSPSYHWNGSSGDILNPLRTDKIPIEIRRQLKGN